MANPEASLDETAKAGRRASVLVVEDDADIREAVAELLREEGYHVATAAQGAEALARLKNGFLPSVVVLDLMMPVMNGWQFREAQVRDPELAAIPVVIVSADGAAAREAVQLGAAAFLQKPIELEELLATVARYCPPRLP